MTEVARTCKRCEETDFEHVSGTVWRCKACGTLSGNVAELVPRETTVHAPKKAKRKLASYRPATIKCSECRGVIHSLRYPVPGEFLKLQKAWKQHQCQKNSPGYV